MNQNLDNHTKKTHMADPPPYADAPDDTAVGRDRGSSTGTSLWVYVFAIIAIGVVLLFVVLHLIGGGLGPGIHTPSGGP